MWHDSDANIGRRRWIRFHAFSIDGEICCRIRNIADSVLPEVFLIAAISIMSGIFDPCSGSAEDAPILTARPHLHSQSKLFSYGADSSVVREKQRTPGKQSYGRRVFFPASLDRFIVRHGPEAENPQHQRPAIKNHLQPVIATNPESATRARLDIKPLIIILLSHHERSITVPGARCVQFCSLKVLCLCYSY
ncbi:hypothetical protein BKA93DRAFT_209119 [Sparassis latifolia]